MKRMITRLLAGILLVLLLVPEFPVTALAAERKGGVTLKNPDRGELLPFSVTNMFPGDSVTKEYEVTVVHDDPITLHFRADLRPDAQYQKLAEVLKFRIELPHYGITLYDGLLGDIPASFDRQLPAREKKITYRITAYLDTSVGNAYMNKELVADFRWWYLDEEGIPVTITAEKTLDGQYARGSKFTFLLLDEDGDLVDTAKNDDGHIEFDTLCFTLPGTYRYTLVEKRGSDPNILYDPAVYDLTITISPDGECELFYTRSGRPYGRHKLPRFTNVSKGQQIPDDPSDVHPSNPKTGDDFPLTLLSVIAVSSLSALVCLFLLWKDRKEKEEQP